MKESLFHVIIKAVGETILGKTVKLVASNDVSLQAATNTSEKLEMLRVKAGLLELILVLLEVVYLDLMQVLMLQKKRVTQR